MSIFRKGLLQDEEFLIAAGLLQQGAQGKGIGEAVFPAIAQAGQVKKIFGKTAQKTKGVYNLVTGTQQFATESQIANSNGMLVPIPKENKENNKTKAVMNTETGNEEFATDKMILESNGILVPIKKEPLVKIEGDKKENAFEKGMGELDVKFVGKVKKDSEEATIQNGELNILNELYAELNTGKFGTSLLELAKIGQRFGIDTNWLSGYDKGQGMDKTIANAEILQVLSSQFVLNAIGQTKGAISDKEMAFFQSIAPNLSMSPEGIKNLISITERMNNRKIEKATLLEQWTADGTLPSRQKNVDGKMMTFNQMWNDHVNGKTDGELNNPLFTKEEKDAMFNLKNTTNLDSGVEIIEYQGKKYYVLPNGDYLEIG